MRCPSCIQRQYNNTLGSCSNPVCSNSARSMDYKLCSTCSAQLGRCEHCGRPLPGTNPRPLAWPLNCDCDTTDATAVQSVTDESAPPAGS